MRLVLLSRAYWTPYTPPSWQNNRVVHKTFSKTAAEYASVRSAMFGMRDLSFTAWAKREAHGKTFEWLLWTSEVLTLTLTRS